MKYTEHLNPHSKGIDRKSTREILRIINEEDSKIPGILSKSLKQIEMVTEDAVNSISSGGRVIYAGAGTSGRLGVLDSSEVPPTFGSHAFKAVIAGGMKALYRASEGAEDNMDMAAQDASIVKTGDMAIGISASGTTPYVISFLKRAKKAGARCWLIACNKTTKYSFLDGSINLITGPEVIAGSTRMKAGTATKLCLNMISTATMIRLQKTFDGYMTDVSPTNGKLILRAITIIKAITGCNDRAANKYLRLSGMRPKTACLMIARGTSKTKAEAMLKSECGSLRAALSNPLP